MLAPAWAVPWALAAPWGGGRSAHDEHPLNIGDQGKRVRTEDGISLEENRAAFQRIKLRTRFLNDWSTRDLSTEIFGERIALPFGIAPTGSAGLMWYQGEPELARAAGRGGHSVYARHGRADLDGLNPESLARFTQVVPTLSLSG